MTPSRLLIWLLLSATVLVDCVVWSLVGAGQRLWTSSWPHPALGVLFALTFSQVSLAAIWAGLSSKTIAWRLAGGLLVVGLWNAALALPEHGMPGHGTAQWIVLLAGQAAIVFAPLSIARARGARFVQTRMTDPPAAHAIERRPWQFSLESLLAWMAAVAVVLGIVYTVDYELKLLTAYRWLDAGILIAGHGAMALAALSAVLGAGRQIARGIVLCLIVAAVLALYTLLPADRVHARAMGVLCLVQASLLVGSLYVCRAAGFRLTACGGHQAEGD